MNPISISEYSQFTPTTIAENSGIKTAEGKIAYRLFGLVGEFGEFVEKVVNNAPQAEINKEAGDYLWYLSETCNLLGFELGEMLDQEMSYEVTPLSALVQMGAISEAAKKLLRDAVSKDKLTVLTLRLEFQVYKLTGMFLLLKALATPETLEEVLAINKDKLTNRKAKGKLLGDGDNR